MPKISDMKTACGYIRVSTDKQEELSPDAQKRLLLDYAKKNHISILKEHIFIENGISGKYANKRPEFQKMIGMAKSKEHPFDVILVWKFSRFARNQEESIVYKSLLKKANVDVISVSEPLVDGPFGSLIERIIEWMDEYYSIRLSGEVIRGMTEKALRGGYQSTVPFGYEMNKDTGIPEIFEDEAVIVRMIFDKFINGMTYLEICREINPLGFRSRRGNQFEARTIKYILENPFYMGYVRWNRQKHDNHTIRDKSEWIIAPGQHQPLFSEEYFNSVQDRILKISRPFKSRSPVFNKHWLSGIVKCSCCGSSLVAKRSNGVVTHFQCGNYFKGACPESHYITTSNLERSIIEHMESILENDEKLKFELRSSNNNSPDHSVIIKNQLDKLVIKEKRIKKAYIDGIDTFEEYKENKKLIQDERNELEAELNKIPTDSDAQTAMRYQIENVMEVIKDSNADMGLKADMLRSVVDHMVYDKKNEELQIFYFLSTR